MVHPVSVERTPPKRQNRFMLARTSMVLMVHTSGQTAAPAYAAWPSTAGRRHLTVALEHLWYRTHVVTKKARGHGESGRPRQRCGRTSCRVSVRLNEAIHDTAARQHMHHSMGVSGACRCMIFVLRVLLYYYVRGD